MKKYIFLIILAFGQYLFAEYHPTLVANRVWYCLDGNSGHVFPMQLTQPQIEINGKVYWDMGNRALREDIEEQRIYVMWRGVNGYDETTPEYLQVDYNCSVGDIVSVPCKTDGVNRVIDCLVEDVSVIDDRKHITVRLDIPEYLDMWKDEPLTDEVRAMINDALLEEWVEGVGISDNGGILLEHVYNVTYAGVGARIIVCVLDNDNIVYENDYYGRNCNTITALNEVPADELLTISDNVLTLKDTDANAVSAIFSADGRQVMSFTGNTADISSLPQGLYVLRTAAANGKNLTAKFVK